MRNWFIIPITKEEFVKISLVISWLVPVAVYLLVWDFAGVFMYWIFPAIFTGFFKDIYEWDWHIKVKFFEKKEPVKDNGKHCLDEDGFTI